jgi:hypothetical protein
MAKEWAKKQMTELWGIKEVFPLPVMARMGGKMRVFGADGGKKSELGRRQIYQISAATQSRRPIITSLNYGLKHEKRIWTLGSIFKIAA